jgi:tetratricopeptide (TPR) repeat protein
MPNRESRERRSVHARRSVVVGAILSLWLTSSTSAQPPVAPTVPSTPLTAVDVLFRALALEDSSRYRESAVFYRRAIEASSDLDADQQMLALLGFERVASELGLRDSVVAMMGRVLSRRPTDATAHAIRLRTVRAIGVDAGRAVDAVARADSAVRAVFIDWTRAAPGDAAPYREYARLLIDQRRTAAADSVVQDAAARLRSLDGLRTERATIDALLSRWGAAGRGWSEAIRENPWNETSALFSLQAARSSGRDSVRAALIAARAATRGDTTVVLARVQARLELGWGEARQAWATVETMAAGDSVVELWRDVAERFEFNESWSLARDAWTRTADVSGRDDDALRLARAALNAGDPARALTAASAVARRLRDATGASNAGDTVGQRKARTRSRALPLMVEALARLGRLESADSLVRAAGTLDAADQRGVQRAMAVGWLRSGNSARARIAYPTLDDDDELRGWRALLEGDLAVARKALARAGSREPVLVTALSIVARTPVLRSESIARVVVGLSRADTAMILAACDSAAAQHADAAPALLTLAARVAPLTEAPARWATILARYPKTVDAPEAALELARATARRNPPDAIPLYEQMILDYPDSALVPLARRELERLVRATPGDA